MGKSSLFNRLVESDRAIVTATPGTTRDLVTETVALGGIPVKLVDTAGIRRALDEAESIGIRKSMEALADADLVLVVLDSSATGRGRRSPTACTGGAADRNSGRKQIRQNQFAVSGSQFPVAEGSSVGADRRRHSRAARRNSAPRWGRIRRQRRNWFPHQRPSSGPGARRAGCARCQSLPRCAARSRTRWSCSIFTMRCVRSMRSPAPLPTMTS